MTILFPNRQIAAQREAAEGVEETGLDGADLIQVMDPRIRPIANSFERPLASPGFGTNPDHFSTAAMEITFGVEVAGARANTGGYTATPVWSRLLEACGWNRVDLYFLAGSGGTVSGGPLQHLEQLDGASAGEATMLGYGYTLESDPFWPVTGVGGGPGGSVGGAPTAFGSSEGITGARSGATATATGTASLAADVLSGDAWYPNTTEVENKSLTMWFNIDGQLYAAYGCRGNVEFNFASHDRVVMQFTFQGIFADATATAALDEFQTGAFGVLNPPGLLNAGAKFVTRDGSPKTLSGSAFCWSNATLNAGANVQMRNCANGANGYQAAVIANRDPRFTIDPDDPGVATMPFVQNMLNGTLSRFEMVWGTQVGNRFALQMPYLQTVDLSPDAREERANWGVQAKLTRGINDGADAASIGQDNELLFLCF